MDNLKNLAATTALNSMLVGKHFSICAIDSVAKMLNVNPASDAYNVLHTVHCIDFEKMPAELRQAIPGLIKECLGVAPVYEFKTMDREAIEVSPVKRGFLRVLGRG
jgi:hypothetical protein